MTKENPKYKDGQTVRVLGLVKNSWVLGQVVGFTQYSITVSIKNWHKIPSDSFHTIPYDQVEPIADGGW